MTITVSEYATRYGCSSQYVASQLRSGKLMTGMLSVRKIEGKTSSWLIEVNLEWYKLEPCKHLNIDRQDGLDKCLDCGAKNY